VLPWARAWALVSALRLVPRSQSVAVACGWLMQI